MKTIIITWNVAGLPYLINFSGTPVQKAYEILLILDTYLKNKNKVVVCNLQEMFDNGLIKDMIELLKNNGYYYYYNPFKKNKYFGINSGLFTISNHPITESKFIKYKNSHGEDTFSNKGISSCLINKIWFINTHMQNGNVMIGSKSDGTNAHYKQISELNNVLNNEKGKYVCAGDFNMNLSELKKNIDIKHSWTPKIKTCINGTPDYIFTNFSIPNYLLSTKSYDDLSDHKMVIFEF